MINQNLSWSHLSPHQLGKYAEYFAKMEATRLGWDVYAAEVDDKGIDFVLRVDGNRYLDMQVKSLRWPGTKYIFVPKSIMKELRPNLYILLVLFEEASNPEMFAIPSTVWRTPNSMFVDRDFDGLKSKPEYGIQIPRKLRNELDQFKFRENI